MVRLLTQIRDTHWQKVFSRVLRLFLLVFPRPTLNDPALNRAATVVGDLASVSILYWLLVLAGQLNTIDSMGLAKYGLYLVLLYEVRAKAVTGQIKTALLVYFFSVAFFYTIAVIETRNFQSIQIIGSLITIVVSTLTLGYRFGFFILALWIGLLTAFMYGSHPSLNMLIPLSRFTPAEIVPGYIQDYSNMVVSLIDIYICCCLVRAHIFSQLDESLADQKEISMREHKARKSADRANAEKSRFMAAASHDLRQPVSALNLNFESYVQAHPEAKEDGAVKDMAASIQTLNKMLDSILTVSKLQAKVITPTISSVSVASVLQRSFAANSAHARQKKLELRLRTTDIYFDTDPDMLYRAVNNLVDNAVKYTERGAIMIGVRQRYGGQCIFVMDSGIGIAQESKEAIFEEFTMLEDPSRKSAGSGLGLAIVKRTADLLGMQIYTESKPGVGSAFYLKLPKVRQKPPKEAAGMVRHAQPYTPPLKSLKGILVAVIDDVETVRTSICRSLQANGMKTVDAGSWAEMMVLIENVTPDILITDYQLDQDASGYDVVLAARKHISEKLPCFIITGDTSPDLVKELADLNVETCFKPLSTETLIAAIHKQLSAARNA